MFKKLYLLIGLHTADQNTLLGKMHLLALKLKLLIDFIVYKPIKNEVKRYFHNESLNAEERTTQESVESWYKLISGSNVRYLPKKKNPIFEEALADEKVLFNLQRAYEVYQPEGIALIFFMGIGDYLYITPFLQQLRKEFPGCKLWAFVSSTLDSTNSPVVATALESNPNVDNVFVYKGIKSNRDWRNYDWNDAKKHIPHNFIAFPIIYENDKSTRNRVSSICDIYGLHRPDSILPIIYSKPEYELAIDAVLENILDCSKSFECQGVVLTHLEARSSNYIYPYSDEVHKELLRKNFIVVSINGNPLDSTRFFQLDIKKYSINESWALVKKLKDELGERLKMITIPSVFSPVSSAFGIRNLLLQHFYNEAWASIWFNNLIFLSDKDYPAIPETNVIIAGSDEYKVDERGFINYNPNLVIKAFENMYLK